MVLPAERFEPQTWLCLFDPRKALLLVDTVKKKKYLSESLFLFSGHIPAVLETFSIDSEQFWDFFPLEKNV